MQRILTLWAALAAVALSANAWNLQGVRIGRVNINGTDSANNILHFYAPRIRQQLLGAGIQGTGDPDDFTLSVVFLNVCNQGGCGGAVSVAVTTSHQEQRQITVWQSLAPYAGNPGDIPPKLIDSFILDYLRDNQRQP